MRPAASSSGKALDAGCGRGGKAVRCVCTSGAIKSVDKNSWCVVVVSKWSDAFVMEVLGAE